MLLEKRGEGPLGSRKLNDYKRVKHDEERLDTHTLFQLSVSSLVKRERSLVFTVSTGIDKAPLHEGGSKDFQGVCKGSVLKKHTLRRVRMAPSCQYQPRSMIEHIAMSFPLDV